jgi:elongation factor P hydroxylase
MSGCVPSVNPLRCERLEQVFNDCFAKRWRTRLCGGAEEPLYQPALDSVSCHTLFYREDYFASALHEVAHWCIAGPARRQLLDFGYWYAPQERGVAEQRDFESVEVKPQALEWFFARACDFRFQVSADNLELARQGQLDTAGFQRRVVAQAGLWQQSGLPQRAGIFYQALCAEFGTTIAPCEQRFSLRELQA